MVSLDVVPKHVNQSLIQDAVSPSVNTLVALQYLLYFNIYTGNFYNVSLHKDIEFGVGILKYLNSKVFNINFFDRNIYFSL